MGSMPCSSEMTMRQLDQYHGNRIFVFEDAAPARVGPAWRSGRRGRHTFPELGTDLVSALSGLEVDDFSHGDG